VHTLTGPRHAMVFKAKTIEQARFSGLIFGPMHHTPLGPSTQKLVHARRQSSDKIAPGELDDGIRPAVEWKGAW